MLEQMAEKGVTGVLLEVRESNLPAQNCYAQAGFTVVGRRKNYYELSKEDALLMGRVLE
jgi:ribosomal-protein-alanine N-acetyltransferase